MVVVLDGEKQLGRQYVPFTSTFLFPFRRFLSFVFAEKALLRLAGLGHMREESFPEICTQHLKGLA